MELVFGTAGALITLVGFLLNQYHKIDSDSLSFDLLNFIGATLLLIYSIQIESYPFVAVNMIWALFSLKDLIKRK